MVAAITAGAIIVGSAITADSNSSAASEAAGVQRDASAASTAQRNEMFTKTQALLQPWVDAGNTARTQQGNLIGLGGNDAQAAAIDRLKTGPEFGAMKTVGENAILSNASATGGLRGGNVNAALGQYDQSLLSGLINQQYARLTGISTQGSNAAAQVGTIGTNVGNANSDDINNAGAAGAGGILGNARATAGLVNGAVNAAGVLTGYRGAPPPTTVATTPNGVPLTGGFGGGPAFV